MKLSHFKYNKEIIQAILDGKQIQHTSTRGGPWYDTTEAATGLFDDFRYHYRIKPTPTLRPWRPEEVPVGALIRRKSWPETKQPAVILGVNATYYGFGAIILNQPIINETESHFFISDLATYNGGPIANDRMEHSLDHGKTWLPCGVME